MFRVFKVYRFEKSAKKLLTESQDEEVEQLINDLKNEKIVGQPLTYPFFREKKIRGKRVYFLVYEDLKVAFLVNVSKKKYQQETIDEIKALLPAFKKEAEKIASTQ